MDYPHHDPRSPLTPLTPAEIDGLDRLLQELDADGVMSLDGVDGFLTALVVGPPQLLKAWPAHSVFKRLRGRPETVLRWSEVLGFGDHDVAQDCFGRPFSAHERS